MLTKKCEKMKINYFVLNIFLPGRERRMPGMGGGTLF
jgi:hypothetical protein